MIKINSAMLKIIVLMISIIIILKLCLVFLWPFIISLIIVFFLEPLIKYFIKIGLTRKVSAVLSYTISLFFIVLIIVYLSKYASKQIITSLYNLPQTIEFLSKRLNLKNVKINYNQIINTLQQFLISYKDKAIKIVYSTAGGVIYIIIIFITSIYISIDAEIITEIIKKLIPSDLFSVIKNVTDKIENIINLEIKLVLSTAFQTAAGLYILGVKQALTIGFICGILDILPIVGPSMIFIPWIIYEFLAGKIVFALGLAFLYILLQVVREILEVKLVGKNLRIHPVITIISLYVGVVIFGIYGVMFGPLMVILAKELYNKFYEGRIVKDIWRI